VRASTAANAPLSSPKNSTPPAVESTPPQELPGPIWGYSQTMRPVDSSRALRYFLPGSPGTWRVEPP
jgi:hypothetical protein